MTNPPHHLRLRFHALLAHPAFRMTSWIGLLAVLTAAAIWCHAAVGKLENGYASAGQAIGWSVYALGYACLMWPLWQGLRDQVAALAAPADDTRGADGIAGAIAFAVIAGLTLIALLLVFDYLGHASVTDAAAVQEQQAQLPAAGAAPAPTRAGRGFLQEFGPHLGTFGDFFGGVANPILTFFTLVGLAITILLQRVQLREARAEARRSRDNAQIQTFETTFFNLLNLHAENIQNLVFDPSVIPDQRFDPVEMQRLTALNGGKPIAPRTVHGRAVFGAVLRATMHGAAPGYSQLEAYRTLQREHNEVLGHYFRHLYQILKLVNVFLVDGTEEEQYRTRKRYTNIVRAQLSAHELAVLLLNCTPQTVDDGKFRDLLLWFQFLEHLPMKETNGELEVLDIAPDTQWIVFEYFGPASRKHPLRATAFGKHPVVQAWLQRQGEAWCGPLPMPAQNVPAS